MAGSTTTRETTPFGARTRVQPVRRRENLTGATMRKLSATNSARTAFVLLSSIDRDLGEPVTTRWASRFDIRNIPPNRSITRGAASACNSRCASSSRETWRIASRPAGYLVCDIIGATGVALSGIRLVYGYNHLLSLSSYLWVHSHSECSLRDSPVY